MHFGSAHGIGARSFLVSLSRTSSTVCVHFWLGFLIDILLESRWWYSDRSKNYYIYEAHLVAEAETVYVQPQRLGLEPTTSLLPLKIKLGLYLGKELFFSHSRFISFRRSIHFRPPIRQHLITMNNVPIPVSRGHTPLPEEQTRHLPRSMAYNR